MTPLEAALLGLLQGLTEFLPVSSSGHLVLGQALLGVRLPGVGFEVAMHVATVVAVLVVYRRRILSLARGLFAGQRDATVYAAALAVASVPAAAAGLLARAFFEPVFERPPAVAGLLLLSGFFAWWIDGAAQRQASGGPTRERLTLVDALFVGVAQAAAILPGISRSGSTVAAGAAAGVEVVRMAEFSFLLSVPAIAGAAVLLLASGEATASALSGPSLLSGFAVAMVSGVAAIRLFLRMLRTRHFRWFAYYCWLLGGGFLLAAAAVPSLR